MNARMYDVESCLHNPLSSSLECLREREREREKVWPRPRPSSEFYVAVIHPIMRFWQTFATPTSQPHRLSRLSTEFEISLTTLFKMKTNKQPAQFLYSYPPRIKKMTLVRLRSLVKSIHFKSQE